MDPEYARELLTERVSLEEAYQRMRSTYDRLAAENAELLEEGFAMSARMEAALDFAHTAERQLAAANATLDEERAAYAVLLESHEIILDALRELCGPNKTISNSTCMKMVDLLYPQPKETTDDE